MLRAELKRRYGDFHALRHRPRPELARNSVDLKVTQTALRRSAPRVTANRYMHFSAHGVARALHRLAPLPTVVVHLFVAPSAQPAPTSEPSTTSVAMACPHRATVCDG